MKEIIFLVALLFTGSAVAQISWGPVIDVASSSYGCNHPRVVLDGSGNALVCWGNSENMMFSRWNGSSFTTPTQINPAGVTIAEQTWMGPDIAAQGDIIYAVYKETPESDVASDIYCVASADGGMTWGSPVQVDAYIGSGVSRFPTVTIDDDGNPIVAFMKFDPGFTGARWVVSRSMDGGATFGIDTLASGWSSATSEVCDCCPGSVTASSDYVAMCYRDNDSDIRDIWVGVSTDTATSFTSGMGVDQSAWNINYCPSSGPDAIIVGDTIISAFMNGATGMSRVYFNKSSIVDMVGSPGTLLTGSISGLSQQNYPRISNYGSNAAIVWKQIVSGTTMIPVLFTTNIASGFPVMYDTVVVDDITNTDLAVGNGEITVVWQNNIDGIVRCRKGTFTATTGLSETSEKMFSIYPNPSSTAWNITSGINEELKVTLTDLSGRVLIVTTYNPTKDEGLSIDNNYLSDGVYSLLIQGEQVRETQLLIKQ